MTDLRVKIGELVLPNPVGVASGCFGFGKDYGQLIEVNRLGALYTKAVTLEPRAGNDIPRLADTPSGMLNSIGLANPGLEGFVSEKLPEIRQFSCPVIVNIAGKTEDDYALLLEKLEELDGFDGYELNISCPNVKEGGLAFGTNPELVERLVKRLATILEKKRQKRPLIVKLSPNVTDIAAIARAAESGGATAISAINTVLGMVIDTKKRKPVLAMGSGGLSGPAIRPVGVAAVWRISRAVKIPVIGLGGIMNTDDAIQYFMAGATAIQMGTALFSRPEAPLEVIDGIKSFMEENRLNSMEEIRGLLKEA